MKVIFPQFEIASCIIIGKACKICNKIFLNLDAYEKHTEEKKDDPLHVVFEIMNS